MGCREKVAMFQNIFLFKNKIVQIYKYGIIAHSSPLLLPLSPAAAALCQWEAMTRSGGDWEPMRGREVMWPGPVLPLSAVTASLGSASTDRSLKYFLRQSGEIFLIAEREWSELFFLTNCSQTWLCLSVGVAHYELCGRDVPTLQLRQLIPHLLLGSGSSSSSSELQLALLHSGLPRGPSRAPPSQERTVRQGENYQTIPVEWR